MAKHKVSSTPKQSPKKKNITGKHAKQNQSKPEPAIKQNTPSSVPTQHKTLLLPPETSTPWYDPPSLSAATGSSNNESKKSNKQKDVSSQKELLNTLNPKPSSNHALVNEYRAVANSLLATDLHLFGSNSSNSTDDKWIEGTIKKGTLKDRIAAMSVLLGEYPVHKLHVLDQLLQMCSGNSDSRMKHMAAESLLDLFENTYLPADRKLFGMEYRPLERNESPRILLLWRVEEMIKGKFCTFLKHLKDWMSEGTAMDMDKLFALKVASTLLSERPEQEQELLSMIVNKIGDPNKKVASRASYHLQKILERHPVMTGIIAREVVQLTHRPRLSPKALYNCIIFLNQLQLTKEVNNNNIDPTKTNSNGSGEGQINKSNQEDIKKLKGLDLNKNLPTGLIQTYFTLFETITRRNGAEKKDAAVPIKSRLLSALLTGVNRAHPYLPNKKSKDDLLAKHMDSLYRIVHVKDSPVANTQALLLLYQTITPATEIRFYRALYAKITSPHLMEMKGCSTLFFHLLYKTLKKDDNAKRVQSFCKRALRTASIFTSNAAVLCGVLFLISKLPGGVILSSLEAPPADDVAVDDDGDDNEERKKKKEEVISRDPTQGGPFWEVSLLNHHYHPTVTKFANQLCSGTNIEYRGDPLQDFSLTKFLDKFAYRHAKKQEPTKKRRSVAERRFQSSEPLGKQENLGKKEDEVFFKRYFEERKKRDSIKGISRKKKGEDEENVLDAIEGQVVDMDDENWDTDPEEEAFVNSLAEKLMSQASGGMSNMDDEDPDLEGWNSDISDGDSDDDDDDDDVDYSKMDGLGGDDEGQDDDDDDDDDVSVGDLLDEEENDISNVADHDDDDDAFMDAGDDSDSDNDQGDYPVNTLGDDNDSNDDDDFAASMLAEDSDSEEDKSSPKKAATNAKSKKSKRQKPESGFADAEDYEAIIANGLEKNKADKNRKRVVEEEEEGKDEGGGKKMPEKKKKKKRKKKPKERKT